MAKNICPKDTLFDDLTFASGNEEKTHVDQKITKPEREIRSTRKKTIMPSARKSKQVITDNPRLKQTERVNWYLTPRIMEAFTLYKKVHFPLENAYNESRIINQILEEIFKKELKVLDSLDSTLDPAARMLKALSTITSDLKL